MSGWSVYLARCADGSLYTGIARDPVKRLAEHNAGRGSKYVRSRRPARLVCVQAYASRSAALRREAAIKRMTRGEKIELIRIFAK
ncbi:MAG: GIY-YIG nuclease family protein [Patescibacteria group bacterium]